MIAALLAGAAARADIGAPVAPAPGPESDAEFETRMTQLIRATVTELSLSKDVLVQSIPANAATEIQVHYHPGDEASILGLGNTTQMALASLLNELSIAEQRDRATAEKHPFDLHKRRLLFIRFYRLDQ